MLKPLGRVTVPVAGTPVLLANVPGLVALMDSYAGEGMKCKAILVQVSRNNTGRVYIGDATLDAAAEIGMYAVLVAPTSTQIMSFNAMDPDAPNSIHVGEIAIDVSVGGDGVILSAVIQ